jgi:hypothetical protein
MQPEMETSRTTNLFSSFLNVMQTVPVCCLREAAPLSRVFILVISLTQPLRAEVKGIPERFMNAFKDVSASHKDLVTLVG